MATIIIFIFAIIGPLLNLLWFAIIASAVMSWLVAFEVINLRNPLVYNVSRFLDAITRPFLRPVQRIIPTLGGIDISPIIVILIIGALLQVLPRIEGALLGLVGG
ncbi:YggT family protein [Phenylobacterium sp.]|uniref:YggT family protein n=1 Tax=Phenylobacterium sp. TaxID=1871053 RepID=UPI00356372CA